MCSFSSLFPHSQDLSSLCCPLSGTFLHRSHTQYLPNIFTYLHYINKNSQYDGQSKKAHAHTGIIVTCSHSVPLSLSLSTHILEMDGGSERGNEREKEQTVEPGKAGYKTNPDSCLQRQSGVHMAHLHRVRRQERIVSCPKTGRENLDTRLTQIKLD